MKTKHLAIIYLLILTIGTIVSIYIPKAEVAGAEQTQVIPDEAIRLRILANSDEEKDQAVKRLIRDEVNKDITEWVRELTSLDEARDVITSHLPEIQATAEAVVRENGLQQSVKVDFGQAEFPTKLYGQYLYPAGEYEAVIITLGEGEGANWWCVLFPPLCFLDFSNGTAVSQSPMPDEEEEGEPESTGKVYAATKEEKRPAPAEQVKAEVTEEDVKASEEQVMEEAEQPAAQEETVKQEDAEPQGKANRPVTAVENEDKLAATGDQNQQKLYEGEKEPEVEVKSLFAEIIHELF
ncbi:stage II sporulation protein R [Peribacillus sp. SI8-4]|uniref:stage II sporulation protein R n=1 Tax=Peribacillus sp. SI8-4 TaxID=3048009 RepID=UPI0025542996|nr:stage II sporulation protein R [Peribacillus sp. SI8-4]